MSIIWATSGSGKSHWLANHGVYSPGWGIPLVDGDNVIAAHKAWPKVPRWWRLPNAPEIHALHATIISRLFCRNRDVAVAWWSRLAIVVPVIRRDHPDVEQVLVRIPEDALRRNYEQREELIKAGKSGHSSRSWESYQKGWIDSETDAKRLGLKIFSTFEGAAKALRLHSSANRGL